LLHRQRIGALAISAGLNKELCAATVKKGITRAGQSIPAYCRHNRHLRIARQKDH
jgi:hypothetical protein